MSVGNRLMDDLNEIPLPAAPRSAITLPAAPSDRHPQLPAREVDHSSIASAYVDFILHCNPSYSCNDDDIAALEALFWGPPSSNKVTFDTFEIYRSMARLFDGQLKSWQSFALEIGVSEGDASQGKGQRLSQYVVRLKKWMRQSHIDAFFYYLVGKSHPYYLDIPPLSEPHPTHGRDGVLTSDDLALRAINPALRPRRGRRRLEAAMEDLPQSQQHTIESSPLDHRRESHETPWSEARSALPESAMTDRIDNNPWSSISNTPRSGGPAQPRSAYMTKFKVSPLAGKRTAEQAFSPLAERKSAVSGTPSGLAHVQTISSPNTTVSRPPVNDVPMSAVSAASTASKRQRLSLQVPQHQGGPIKLMTPTAPPPNTEHSHPVHSNNVTSDDIDSTTSSALAISYESLRRSLAADLVRAQLKGRTRRLSGAEAKSLATTILSHLNLASTSRHKTAEYTLSAAIHLGLAHLFNPCAAAGLSLHFDARSSIKTLHVTRFVRDEDGYETELTGASQAPEAGQSVKEVFDLSWTVNLGAMTSSCVLRGLEFEAGEGVVQEEHRTLTRAPAKG